MKKLLFILFLLPLTAMGPTRPQPPTVLPELVFKAVPDEFSPEALRDYIDLLGILHPDIVYGQALLETGNFTSTIFLENHNLFGMKYVNNCNCFVKKFGGTRRSTTATGELHGHAKYRNWKESVQDYLLWQQMFELSKIDTKVEYFLLLDRVYAIPGKYVGGLKQVMKQV